VISFIARDELYNSLRGQWLERLKNGSALFEARSATVLKASRRGVAITRRRMSLRALFPNVAAAGLRHSRAPSRNLDTTKKHDSHSALKNEEAVFRRAGCAAIFHVQTIKE